MSLKILTFGVDITEPNDLCEFIIINDDKVKDGWPFDRKTITVDRRTLTRVGSHRVLPDVEVTTETGKLLKECMDEQTCSFSVEQRDLKYRKKNNIFVKASVLTYDFECSQVVEIEYSGISAIIIFLSGSLSSNLFYCRQYF